jgi:hypothetical protein
MNVFTVLCKFFTVLFIAKFCNSSFLWATLPLETKQGFPQKAPLEITLVRYYTFGNLM